MTEPKKRYAHEPRARRRAVKQLRADGWTFREISLAFGFSTVRARQLSMPHLSDGDA